MAGRICVLYQNQLSNIMTRNALLKTTGAYILEASRSLKIGKPKLVSSLVLKTLFQLLIMNVKTTGLLILLTIPMLLAVKENVTPWPC